MSKLGHITVGVIATVLARNILRRMEEWAVARNLTQPDLTPGAWYAYYTGDWLTAFPGKPFTTALIPWTDGKYMWVTDTPEWDRGWFEARGHEFPNEWVTYEEYAAFLNLNQ